MSRRSEKVRKNEADIIVITFDDLEKSCRVTKLKSGTHEVRCVINLSRRRFLTQCHFCEQRRGCHDKLLMRPDNYSIDCVYIRGMMMMG